MDIEFHYYITAFLANKAGFTKEESKIIAYSAQYIDDNHISFVIRDKETGQNYKNYISQTYNFFTSKKKLMRIYPVFHFIPGDYMSSARRRDGRIHLLNTTPNSKYANDIMESAFNSNINKRLYKIGIASHSYIDTWAHQNFVGWYTGFNHIQKDYKPNIGHMDAEQHPDWVSHNWKDKRLINPNINNYTRFNEAVKHLFKHYCHYQYKENGINNLKYTESVLSQVRDFQGERYGGNMKLYSRRRIRNYLRYMPWLNKYNQREWFDEIIDTKKSFFKDSHDKIFKIFNLFRDKYYWKNSYNVECSHWFKFQESIKEHQKDVIEILKPRFDKLKLIKNKSF